MKALLIVEKATNKVVERIDVSHETERGIGQIRTAVRMQMNSEDFRIEEEG